MPKLTHELLDQMSLTGDPDGDAVMARHAAAFPDVAPRDFVRHVVQHLHFPEKHRSPAIQAYLDASPGPTIHADPERLALGAQFFADHAGEIGSALFCASLPMSYAAPRGARVLTLTGRLTDDLVRRVHETAQMVLHVCTPGGLETGTGIGYEDVRRVRLMHAAVRHFILNDPSIPRVAHRPAPDDGWCDDWGMPLNQEDLLGAMLTFTVTVFDVLDLLGIEYVQAEAEAYLHLWCVVASLLGLQTRLLPANIEEAKEHAALIRRRQLGPSPDGRELTQALVKLMQRPAKWVPGFVPAIVRWYVGPDVATMLGLKRNPWQLVLDGPFRWVSDVLHVPEQHDHVLHRVNRKIGAAAVRRFMDSNRVGDRPAYAIPTELQPQLARTSGRLSTDRLRRRRPSASDVGVVDLTAEVSRPTNPTPRPASAAAEQSPPHGR